jgi:hypothetical protein
MKKLVIMLFLFISVILMADVKDYFKKYDINVDLSSDYIIFNNNLDNYTYNLSYYLGVLEEYIIIDTKFYNTFKGIVYGDVLSKDWVAAYYKNKKQEKIQKIMEYYNQSKMLEQIRSNNTKNKKNK